MPVAIGAAVADVIPAILAAPTDGEIRFARLVNGAALAAGNAGNNRSVNVRKGTGAVTAAGTLMHSFTTNGTALAEDTPVSLTPQAAANRRFTAGQTVAVTLEFAGSGGALTAPAFVALYVVYGLYDFATT